ncbi:MAG: tetratricopeptide repeat protein [Saprospiraceae bacterium]|nr:tetratricopeptide repeat protein [Saprospiraceae bacterium]
MCALAFSLCLLAGKIGAQSNKPPTVADSLATLLTKAPPDTQRVNLLTDYAWEINETETGTAEKHLNEAVVLAQKLGFKRGESNAWNGLGVVAEIRGNKELALAHYQKALDIRRQIKDRRGMAGTLTNLGNVYNDMGDVENSVRSHRESLELYTELGDTLRMARVHGNLSEVLQSVAFYEEAYAELFEARVLLEHHPDRRILAGVLTLMGHVRFELDMYKEAHDWYSEALQIRRNTSDEDPANIAESWLNLGNALDEIGSELDSMVYTDSALVCYQTSLSIYEELNDDPGRAIVFTNLGDTYKHKKDYDKAMFYLEKAENIRRELDDQPGLAETYNVINDVVFRKGNVEQSLEYIRKYYDIAVDIGDLKYQQRAFRDFSRAYAALGDFSRAYTYRVRYDSLRYAMLDEQRTKTFELKDALFVDEKNKNEVERQKQALERARLRTYALLGGALALFLLVALLFNRNRLRARANQALAAKNVVIEHEKERADNLLKNILPESVAEELKTNNSVQPVRYESVSVLFTDFKGFTQIAERLSPEDLVAELDACFRLFDSICAKYGLEKIKTIGDAYMCAGGLPEPNVTHAVDAVGAALEMQSKLAELMNKKTREGKPRFDMRVGIHTGPVVAGVVGSHKFAYDIWGDAVNTAARLEQSGEPGRVNISEATYLLVKDRFECQFRGNLSAKNKGEIAMYFVAGH